MLSDACLPLDWMSFVQISLPAARRDLTRLHMQPDANPQIPHLSNPNEPEPNPDSPPREFGRVSKQPEQRRAVSRSLHLLLLLLFLVAFLRINSNLFHSESRKPGIRYACTLLNRGVALTYDDGPSEHTERLLDSLAELEVKATFFLVGLNARKRPDVVRRMIRDGHTVGSHTMSHANLTKVYAENRTKFWEEVDGNSALLREITGQWPRYLRPPYGAIDRRVLKELNARGYEVVMWGGGCIDCTYPAVRSGGLLTVSCVGQGGRKTPPSSFRYM